MRTLIAFLLLTATAHGLDKQPFGPVVDHVDKIEVSHVYDSDGKLIFTQFIFLDWMPGASCYNIRAWRLAKDDRRPVYDARRDLWILTWFDGKTLRSVRANAFIERHDQVDPELVARETFPQQYRRELTNPAMVLK